MKKSFSIFILISICLGCSKLQLKTIESKRFFYTEYASVILDEPISKIEVIKNKSKLYEMINDGQIFETSFKVKEIINSINKHPFLTEERTFTGLIKLEKKEISFINELREKKRFIIKVNMIISDELEEKVYVEDIYIDTKRARNKINNVTPVNKSIEP